MRDHVRILAYLHIVFGGLGTIAAVIVLVVFGGIAGIVGAANPGDPDVLHIAMPVLGVVGLVVSGFVLLVSLPGVITGFGLLKFRPWARMLGIVLSALDLPGVPIGTALGVYGLWVLLQPETERLFV
jgi:Na+-driven multidrug efflux pump